MVVPFPFPYATHGCHIENKGHNGKSSTTLERVNSSVVLKHQPTDKATHTYACNNKETFTHMWECNIYRWLSARLQERQYTSNGVTAVLHLAMRIFFLWGHTFNDTSLSAHWVLLMASGDRDLSPDFPDYGSLPYSIMSSFERASIWTS